MDQSEGKMTKGEKLGLMLIIVCVGWLPITHDETAFVILFVSLLMGAEIFFLAGRK
jgi:hypothetical protein